MTPSSRFPWLAVLLTALIALGAWDVSRRFEVDAGMDHFLPQSSERSLYRISRKVLDSTMTRQMLLTITSAEAEREGPEGSPKEQQLTKLAAFAKQLSERLAKVPGIFAVVSGPPEGVQETFFELYFPRRHAYYSLSPEQDADRFFSPAAVDRRIASLKAKLGGSEGVAIRALAPRDPLLLFLEFLEGLKGGTFDFDIIDGQFVSPNDQSDEGPAAVLFVELSDSALDGASQRPTLQGVDEAIADTLRKNGGRWSVESTGMNRFAVAAETTMKADVERVVGLSTIGLLLLFLGLFRLPRRMAFVLLPIAAGLVAGAWVSLLLYGKLHALTLAFGASLIGVALDYPVHALCHFELDPERRSPQVTLRTLRPTLLFAAGTTIAGLAGLGWTDFPGIREIAVFTSIGVVAALITTFLLGGLLSSTQKPPTSMQRFASALERSLVWLRTHRFVPLVLFVVASLLSLYGLTRTRFAPGLEALAPSDAALVAEDARVRSRIGGSDEARFIVSAAPNLEEALQGSERAELLLQAFVADGSLGGFTSVSRLLRSTDLQKRALESVPRASLLTKRIHESLNKAGFVPEAFPDLEAEFQNQPAPLTWADLETTPLHKILAPFVLSAKDEFVVVTALRDVRDEAGLKAAVASIPGLDYFSQRAVLDQAYSDLRARTTHLLLLGLLLVGAAAFARYRNARRALAAILPALLAACSTLGWLALAGEEVHLLHILGLLLACSMGVDYGVFLVDTTKDSVGAALLSICIGCLSTILSFGALSLSSAPALHALGTTITSGVFLSLILAPTTFLFLKARSATTTEEPS